MDDGSRKNDDDAMSHPTSKGRRNGGRRNGAEGKVGGVRGLRLGRGNLAAIEAKISSLKGLRLLLAPPLRL